MSRSQNQKLLNNILSGLTIFITIGTVLSMGYGVGIVITQMKYDVIQYQQQLQCMEEKQIKDREILRLNNKIEMLEFQIKILDNGKK